MLPKKFRLTKEKDFEHTFKKGRGFFVQELGIKCVKNNLTHPRVGIVVSNKISKKAVERNKIKRRLRQAIQECLPSVKNPIDILIITRPFITTLDYREIEKRVTRCLTALRLINKK